MFRISLKLHCLIYLFGAIASGQFVQANDSNVTRIVCKAKLPQNEYSSINGAIVEFKGSSSPSEALITLFGKDGFIYRSGVIGSLEGKVVFLTGLYKTHSITSVAEEARTTFKIYSDLSLLQTPNVIDRNGHGELTDVQSQLTLAHSSYWREIFFASFNLDSETFETSLRCSLEPLPGI